MGVLLQLYHVTMDQGGTTTLFIGITIKNVYRYRQNLFVSYVVQQ